MFRERRIRRRGAPAALLLTLLLGGCAQTTGLGALSVLTGGESASEAAAPAGEAQLQLAAAIPGEIPPLPTRRPGKRPRTPALPAEASAPATTAAGAEPAQPAKEESSGLSLASLGNSLFSGSSSGAEGGPDAVLIDQPVIGAYSLLAQRIKYCWLNATSPRLPNHGFFAEIPPGEVRETKMIVYEKNAEGRRGTTVFKVDITAESSGALVTAQNAHLDKPTEAAFKADLARWAKGDDRCKP
jgi:hypothetical protein